MVVNSRLSTLQSDLVVDLGLIIGYNNIDLIDRSTLIEVVSMCIHSP